MRMGLRLLSVAVRVVGVVACLLGIWESWSFARSDELYWQSTAESTEEAIRLEPDCWECYIQLARLDDKDAEKLLNRSLQLNPFNSDADIDLGLRYEADGDLPRAEKFLLQAFKVDHSYAPRWSLANYYFRRDNIPLFWAWARLAAEMPADDISALFELCWRASPNPKTIEENVVGNNPSVIRQYVDFLISKNHALAAVYPGLRLVRTGSPAADRIRLFNLIGQVIAANDAAGVASLWHELIRQHWVVADSSILNNPEFARDPLPGGLDWNLTAYDGLHSWPGSSGLVTEFTGDEPESCIIAEQIVLLQPGNYSLESSYHTRNIAAGTGIRWELEQIEPNTLLASSPFLSSDTPASFALPFTVGPELRILRLKLVYVRQIGTPRISGTLVVASITLQALPSK